MNSKGLWEYFQDIKRAVDAANKGVGTQPYVRGNFIVSALADDIELTISDISEEDAILITSELTTMGVKAVMTGTTLCANCGERVPQQSYCTNCRTKLAS